LEGGLNGLSGLDRGSLSGGNDEGGSVSNDSHAFTKGEGATSLLDVFSFGGDIDDDGSAAIATKGVAEEHGEG